MSLPRSLASYHQSAGNMAVLVLVDSTQPEYYFVFESTFAALSHFGIPMRVLDLSREKVDNDQLATCSLVVIGQEHLGGSLDSKQVSTLLKAITTGLGVVNFDCDLSLYGPELLAAVGVKGTGRSGEVAVSGSPGLNVRGNDHPVTWMQDGKREKRFRIPVPTRLATVAAADVDVLLEDDDGFPLLVTRRVGVGKLVQWLVSPRVWLRQFYGHTFGLDDIWVRSLIWAARKPFVMKAMPPFVRLRFDDCQGLWNEAADLAFVDILNQMGHVPSLCFCVRSVGPGVAEKMRQLYGSGKVELAPHTIAPGLSLYYGGPRGEYSRDELAELFTETDHVLARLGAKASRVLSDHDHGWSTHAIPGLEARGITYKMNITVPGEPFDAVHTDWHPAPYGSMDYAFDFLPAPATHFFVVHNHYPPAFEYARTYLDEDHYIYYRAGGYGPYKWDYLNGLTTGPFGDTNQVEAMAQRLADHIRLGLDAMFFGGSISHSHFARHLQSADWHALLKRTNELLPRHRYELLGYDAIADYARSKVQTSIVGASTDHGRAHIRLAGSAVVPLRLYVYCDEEIGDHRYEEVPAFEDGTDVDFVV